MDYVFGMGGSGDDPVARVTGSLGMISEQLKIIPEALSNTQTSEELKRVHEQMASSDAIRAKDGAQLLTSLQSLASALESAHDPVLTSNVDKVSQEVLGLLEGQNLSESEKGEVVLKVLRKIMKFSNEKDEKLA